MSDCGEVEIHSMKQHNGCNQVTSIVPLSCGKNDLGVSDQNNKPPSLNSLAISFCFSILYYIAEHTFTLYSHVDTCA